MSRRPLLLPAVAIVLACTGAAALAAEPVPEIQRAIGTAQAVGTVHTVRQIPEACTRIEGVFSGDAAAPYKMDLVRTSPQCQARAAFMDYAKAQPSEARGWKLNDVIRIPASACSGQQAVIRVWRKPAGQAVQLDGQGQTRIYLQDAKAQAAAGKLAAMPAFAAEMKVEGAGCR